MIEKLAGQTLSVNHEFLIKQRMKGTYTHFSRNILVNIELILFLSVKTWNWNMSEYGSSCQSKTVEESPGEGIRISSNESNENKRKDTFYWCYSTSTRVDKLDDWHWLMNKKWLWFQQKRLNVLLIVRVDSMRVIDTPLNICRSMRARVRHTIKMLSSYWFQYKLIQHQLLGKKVDRSVRSKFILMFDWQ